MKLIFLFIFSFFVHSQLFGAPIALPLGKEVMEKVLKGHIYVISDVDSFKENKKPLQKLDFKIAGLHPKSCRYALKKLSLYEKYSTYLGFVKESSYNSQNQRINFLLNASILPFKMRLMFRIPRITKEGIYPFWFDRGFLKGLRGNITVARHEKRCFFLATASWRGNDSGIPDTLFELFSKNLAKLAMENLFRISTTY